MQYEFRTLLFPTLFNIDNPLILNKSYLKSNHDLDFNGSYQFISIFNFIRNESFNTKEIRRWNSTGRVVVPYPIIQSPLSTLGINQKEIRYTENNPAMNKDASFLASISRALLIALGFFFRRPIRLFRPVKISSWLGLQAIAAERKQKPYDLRFLTGLIREEGVS